MTAHDLVPQSILPAWNEQAPHLTAIDALTRFRWSVIPIAATKNPPIKWKNGKVNYQENRPTKEDISYWHSQFTPSAWAVITGQLSGRFILEFDGTAGLETLEKLGFDPHVRSGSGGYHIHFKHPGWRVKTLNHESDKELGRRWPGMDIRGDGGYAAFCGRNKHGQYIWLRDPDLYDLEILPDDLRDFLGLLHAPEPREPIPITAAASSKKQQLDTNRTGKSLADVHLDKYVDRAYSIGRDNACFEMACQLRDNNFSRSEAESIARSFARRVPGTNTKGQHEPFTEQDALAKVASAYSAAARQPWEDLRTTNDQASYSGNGQGSSNNTTDQRPGSFNCTDLGNAERFATRYRDRVRWCQVWNTWLVFNGKCWEADKSGRVDQLGKATVRAIYQEAADEYSKAAKETDDIKRKQLEQQAKQLSKHAAASESSRAIRAMLDRVKSELPAIPEEFNLHLHLLNCSNGTLDLRTGELRSHQASDMLTRCLKVAYNPLAIAPTWLQFVSAILDNNTSLIDYVQTSLGMSLSGDIKEQCWFLCHGDGNNGKSTLLEIPRTILEDYGLAANIQSFLVRKDEKNYDKAEFYGKRLITSSEIPPKSRLNEAFMKKVTSGTDPLRAERKFEHEFQFTPECTIWLSVNHKPVVKDTSKGMWRRVRYIPFNVTIPDDQVDTDLPKKLLAEAEGILAWLVAGCKQWYEQGRLITPEIVKEATKKYEAEQDTIARFLSEECNITSTGKVFTTDLNARYEYWCDQKQERPDAAALKEALNKQGLRSKRSTGGKWRYEGIELKPIDEPPTTPTTDGKSDGSSTSPSSKSDGSDGSDIKRSKNNARESYKETLRSFMSLPSLPSLSELKSSDGTVTFEKAREFYEAFTSLPDHHLRIKEDGTIGIGVPDEMSDADYEVIEAQVEAMKDALIEVLQKMIEGCEK